MPVRSDRRGKSAAPSRIHEGFVGARTLVGTPYLADPALRSEYMRDIAPRTGAALNKILREIFPDPGAAGRPRRVLDLGAGTGAAGAAVRAHFGNELDLTAVDRTPVSANVRAADITDAAALSRAVTSVGAFDLVVAAHVLNELYFEQPSQERPGRIAALVSRWCQLFLATGGTLILIEPALRETSRTLLAARDHLLGAGLHVVAPCFFTGPCPALLRERDWCHDATRLSNRVGADGLRSPASSRGGSKGPSQGPLPNRPEHRVDFSYLVVRQSGEAATDSTLFRIVSDPIPEKGRLKLFACGPVGRQPIVRLDRHATPANAVLGKLVRGDVVHITRTTFAQDGLRVVADTTVTREGNGGDPRPDAQP